MAFQEGALFDSMSVYDNVAFPLRHSGRSPAQVRARVEECLELVQLPDIGAKRPSELSGGMRRRVGFARAIAHQPEILLFDEPNTGLDPITTDVIAEVILGIRRQMEPTIVTITHHIASARKIGDRLALLFGGKILFDAPPEEFMKANDPAVRQFVEGRAEGPLTVEFGEGQATSHFGGAMSTTAKVGAFFLVVLVLTGLLDLEDRGSAVRQGHRQDDLRAVRRRGRAEGRSPTSAWRAFSSARSLAIRLVGGKAVVDIELTRDVALREGASASIQSLGMLGDKYVELDPRPGRRAGAAGGRDAQGRRPGLLRPDHAPGAGHRGRHPRHHVEPEGVARRGARARSG